MGKSNCITLREYYDQRHTEYEKFMEERDRRYAEVALEREKALKIKETADLSALQLAREIQTYKDEKANELREQINSERGKYATKDDMANVTEKFEALIKPLAEALQSNQGRATGITDSGKVVAAILTIGIALIGVLLLVLL